MGCCITGVPPGASGSLKMTKKKKCCDKSSEEMYREPQQAAQVKTYFM